METKVSGPCLKNAHSTHRHAVSPCWDKLTNISTAGIIHMLSKCQCLKSIELNVKSQRKNKRLPRGIQTHWTQIKHLPRERCVVREASIKGEKKEKFAKVSKIETSKFLFRNAVCKMVQSHRFFSSNKIPVNKM